jgi:hypothetical protein
MTKYNARKAAYDLRKLRGKTLVQRIANTRRYRVRRPGIRTLAPLLILREKVLSPYWPESVAPSAAASPKRSIPLTFTTTLSSGKCSLPYNISNSQLDPLSSDQHVGLSYAIVGQEFSQPSMLEKLSAILRVPKLALV